MQPPFHTYGDMDRKKMGKERNMTKDRFNCGTWMDKMGESATAHNRGIPATPRDGAPIEITGLLKSTLRWVSHLHQSATSHFPFEGVALPDSFLSYSAWDALVQASFDSHYFIPVDPADDAECISFPSPQKLLRPS